MTLSLTRWLFILAISAWAGTAAAQEWFRHGFLSYPWGMPIDSMKRYRALASPRLDGVHQWFETEIRVLEGVSIADCEFEFIEGRFSGVLIRTGSAKQSHRLRSWIAEHLGGTGLNGSLGYQWFLRDIHIKYDESTTGEAYIYWYSRAVAIPSDGPAGQ
jgi:hypothetical protein